MTKMIEILREIDPGVMVKPKVVPDVVMRMAPAMDWLGHIFTGRPREVSGKLVAEFAHKHATFCVEKAREDLGWNPREPEVVLADMVAWLKEHPAPRWYESV
jgi:nucleoside-diphosphate-sugar epimerase